VAMDKEYVIRTLGGENKYAYRDYIEKFFQVEMVIKKPSYFDVVKRVIEDSKKAEGINKDNLKKLKEALQDSGSKSLKMILNNYRSAIKLMNQVVVDDKSISYLFNEISPEDYLKFAFLEMNFPKFYEKLISEPSLYLRNERNENFKLKKKPIDKERITNEDISREINEISILEPHEIEYIYDFDDFDFGYELENPLQDFFFTKEESEIIKTIFIEVFEKGEVKPNSLRIIINFYKLIRLKIDEKEISETIFDNILDGVPAIAEKEGFDKIILKNNLLFKSNSLVKKMNVYKPQTREEYKGLLSLLLIMFGNLNSNNENFTNHNLFSLIVSYFDKSNFRLENGENIKYSDFTNLLENYWILNDEVVDSEKLLFILNIKENLFSNSKEDFYKLLTQQKFENICHELFLKYLNGYKENEWAIDDYTFIAILRKLENNLVEVKFKQIKESLKKHFINSPIENFCLQLLKDGYYNVKHKYQISDDVLLVFDSLFEFHEFLSERMSRSDVTKPELNKFLHVLKCYAISKEKFEDGKPILEIFGDKIKEDDNKGFKEVSQIIIEIFDEGIFDELSNVNISRDILNNSHISAFVVESKSFENSKYLYLDIFVHSSEVIKAFDDYMSEKLQRFRVKKGFELNKLIDGSKFIDESNMNVLQVISIRTTNKK